MSRCTGPSARAIRSLSQGDPPAKNCSSGEGRADSTGKEERRQITPVKNVRCEVECSTVRVPHSQRVALSSTSTETGRRSSQKTCAKGKKIYESSSGAFRSAIARDPDQRNGFCVCVLSCNTSVLRNTTDRQTVVLNVAFYCSILPIYMNLYGAIWSYLPREFARARRFGSF
jgi:hypothetical protein